MLLLSLLLACERTPRGETETPGVDDTEETVDPGESGSEGVVIEEGTVVEPGLVTSSARADLRLKRWRQLQLDLEGALDLSSEEICREAGLYDCTDLHVVPLGGVSVPNGLYRPVEEVAATTQLAMERVVLGACTTRLARDLENEPVVFSHLELDSSELSDDELTEQVAELSRRLLARPPVQEEIDALGSMHAELVATGATNADWALLACFAMGSTSEALTY